MNAIEIIPTAEQLLAERTCPHCQKIFVKANRQRTHVKYCRRNPAVKKIDMRLYNRGDKREDTSFIHPLAIGMSDHMLEVINKAVLDGQWSSRSEFIRFAVMRLLIDLGDDRD